MADTYRFDLTFGETTGPIFIEDLKRRNDQLASLVAGVRSLPEPHMKQLFAQDKIETHGADVIRWLEQLETDMDNSLAQGSHHIRFYHLQFATKCFQVKIGLQLRLAEAIALNPFSFYRQIMTSKAQYYDKDCKLHGTEENPLHWPDPYGTAPELWNRLQANILNDVQTIREIHFAKVSHIGGDIHGVGGTPTPGPVCSHCSLSFFPKGDGSPGTLLDFRIAQTAHT